MYRIRYKIYFYHISYLIVKNNMLYVHFNTTDSNTIRNFAAGDICDDGCHAASHYALFITSFYSSP